MNGQCQHGNHWESCPQCELAEAREIERQWGQSVDEARKVIATEELPDSEGGEI